MKFPRNARMLKGHLDFAPFASVFFCLLIFVLLSNLVYTPGVVIELPAASPYYADVQGASVSVEMDPVGRLYFQNHLITDDKLKERLQTLVSQYSPQPLTLKLLAATNAPDGRKMQVLELAAQAGIAKSVWPARPGTFDAPKK